MVLTTAFLGETFTARSLPCLIAVGVGFACVGVEAPPIVSPLIGFIFSSIRSTHVVVIFTSLLNAKTPPF